MDKHGEYKGYNLLRLRNSVGSSRYRLLSILKNSYGIDDVDFGLRFTGEVSNFATLPKPDNAADLQDIFRSILSEKQGDYDIDKYLKHKREI